MSLRRDLAHRTPKEWVVRLVLAVATALLGYYGVAFTIAQVAAPTDPALAYALAPYDGRITAAYAMSLSGVGATPADRSRADSLALAALRQDPTAVVAAATLGTNADARGDQSAAQKYFAYAHRLSRRELRTQLWMIENAVGRGDVSSALRHYDMTLRVFPEMSELLYPVLTSASADPAIRSALVKTLAAKPVWGSSFIDYAAGHGADPRTTIALLSDARRTGVVVSEKANADVVNALLTAGRVDAAWNYYATIRSGVDRLRSRDPHFRTRFEIPSQLDWNPVNDNGLSTGIQGGIFDFSAPPSVGGPMLQQRQVLLPGVYKLSGHSIGIEQDQSERPYWMLGCQDGREFGRVEVPNSNVANGEFSGTIRIPAGCPVQTLLLIARPSNAVSGLSGQFDRVALEPVSR